MLEQFFDAQTMDIVTKLTIALFLGMFIGMERVWAHKTAGMRTYALVSMGAALFVIISDQMVQAYSTFAGLNPLFIAGNILVGVGFIGTGLIVTKDSKLMGLTTATGLWVSAGIGMAAGFGLTKLAIIATFLTLFIFIVIWFIEKQLKKTEFFQDDSFNDIN
ncbi:MAG: MgtC/SapB family protein [Candidatus Pacebacteria bacterium]|nr:MgtC/SapB family protein [Candidatus Paceibacterota bacterium]MBP9715565.1 MgtC/SapB family protein [Candidatus Paceibacterota bacterium]